MDSFVCAIDIGNTNTAVGIINCDDCACVKRIEIPSAQCVQTITVTVKNLLAEFQITGSLPIKISTVIRSVKDAVTHALSGLGPLSWVTCRPDFPVTITYDKPELLGTDRIANCLYCIKKYPETNCIIISAGTAVTVDLLSSAREFKGGFILPGIELQLQNLHRNTAELPIVDHHTDSNEFPPRSTQSAMAQGVFYSVTGGISSIINKVRSEYPAYTTILACGGAWPAIERAFDFQYRYIPDMTLVGVGLYGD